MFPGVYEVKRYSGAKEWKDIKWVCFGDSLTEENIRTSKHYFDFVSEKTGIEVVNMGVGGTGYKRAEEEGKAFYQRIVDVPTDADVVTIFGSGNDLKHIGSLGNPTDRGTDTICGCINTTIDNLYSIMPTVRLGIVSPTPWIYHQPSDNGSMARYSNTLKELCNLRGIPFLDLFRVSGFRPNEEKYRELVFSKDDGNGVHPNELGHELIAPKFKAFLDTLI
jgi:lysophospholipase L1-like esterase